MPRFPAQEIVEALGDKKAIAVLDRSASFGAQINPVCLEVVSALFTNGYSPKLVNYIYGLGGRDTVPAQLCDIYRELVRIDKEGTIGTPLRYLAVRE